MEVERCTGGYANGRMSPRRKELMHQVMEGLPNIAPVLFQIQMYRECDNVLKWLVNNRLTGHTFREWFLVEQDSSPLKMMGAIINDLEKRRKGISKRKLYGYDLG